MMWGDHALIACTVRGVRRQLTAFEQGPGDQVAYTEVETVVALAEGGYEIFTQPKCWQDGSSARCTFRRGRTTTQK